MICCKSSLSSPLVYFRKGDDFWFRAFFFAEGSLPTTIMDLECEWIKLHAGISAHSSREKAAILWVDDVEISDMPIE